MNLLDSHSLVSLLISWSLRGAVVLALGGVASTLARRRSAAFRHAIWCAVLVAVTILPFVQWTAPGWSIRVPARHVSAPSAGTAFAQVVTRAEVDGPSAPARHDDTGWVLGAWLLVTLVLLARLGIGHARLASMARRARRLDDLIWVSEDVTVPVVAGIGRPRILLPAESQEWSAASFREVVLHELAHVRRNDLAWLTFARVLSAVLWFHPLAHWARMRLRAEAEAASDDLVLRSGETPSRYAETLIDLAAGSQEMVAGIPFVRREHLSERIERIVATGRDRAPVGVVSAVLLVMSVLLVGAGVGTVRFAQADTKSLSAKVESIGGADVQVVRANVQVTPVGESEVRLDTPELLLENTSRAPVEWVRVRFTTPGASTDEMWLPIALAPHARGTLRIAPEQWSNTAAWSQAQGFAAAVVDARSGKDAPEEAELAPTPRASLSTSSPPAPENAADRVPAEVLRQHGAPILVEDAWTPRRPPVSSDPFDQGHALTWKPALRLRNTSDKTIVGIRIRYKADAESHAVSGFRQAIPPGGVIEISPGRAMWGRAEKMKVQILGVKFADGSAWGSLDSTIDTRQDWIR
ncbi:MAG TPA: M56 family metallopeptidase [Candidatus Eisenbacteria bacterium]|nr:M56 family metallopeptidase [Candidatus Eisenbacteria bacterium]